jgi:hypothetical protein
LEKKYLNRDSSSRAMELLYKKQDLLRLFQHKTIALEVLYVMMGVKPAARIVIPQFMLEPVTGFCKRNGLVYEVSDFKVVSQEDTGKGGFTNISKRIPLNSLQRGELYVYISKSEEKARLAKLYELDNVKFGEILGYPRCCIEFFKRNFELQSKRQNDYVLPAVKKFGISPFFNNYALRYFDVSLINHFPCSLDCKESEEIGRRNLRVIKRYSPEMADFFVKELKSVVIYTEYKGVFYSSDYRIEGKRIMIGSVRGTVENWMFKLLNETKEIIVRDFNHFFVGKKEMKGNNVGLMIFS